MIDIKNLHPVDNLIVNDFTTAVQKLKANDAFHTLGDLRKLLCKTNIKEYRKSYYISEKDINSYNIASHHIVELITEINKTTNLTLNPAALAVIAVDYEKYLSSLKQNNNTMDTKKTKTETKTKTASDTKATTSIEEETASCLNKWMPKSKIGKLLAAIVLYIVGKKIWNSELVKRLYNKVISACGGSADENPETENSASE